MSTIPTTSAEARSKSATSGSKSSSNSNNQKSNLSGIERRRRKRAKISAQVHVRVASPPVIWPCFYGIDFATRAELIAGHLSPEQICASIGADSLGYVSLDGLTEASGLPASRLCRACFNGQYPIPVAEDDRGKHVLDGLGVGS